MTTGRVLMLAVIIPFLVSPGSAVLLDRHASPCERRVDQVSIDSPVEAYSENHQGVFAVVNTGSTITTGSITCNGVLTVTCVDVEPSSATLEPGDSVLVTTTFDAGAPGTGYVLVFSCGVGNKQRVVVQ